MLKLRLGTLTVVVITLIQLVAGTPIAGLAKSVQSTQKAITLTPALRLGGDIYELSYISNRDYDVTDAIHIFTRAIASSTSLTASYGITAIRLTRNGVPVTDLKTLTRVLRIYHAATVMYGPDENTVVPVQDYSSFFRKVLSPVNLTLIAASPSETVKNFFNQKEIQDQALRSILSDPKGTDSLAEVWDGFSSGSAKSIDKSLDLVKEIAKDKLAENTNMWGVADVEILASLRDVQDLALAGQASLKLFELVGKIVFISLLQADRASWVIEYQAGIPSGMGLSRKSGHNNKIQVSNGTEDIHQRV